MDRLRRHLSYANVVSTLCLFIVLGGTAWAVAANSVGTAQLKNGAVTSAKLANGAVTSSKIADGAILLRALDPSTIANFSDRCPTTMSQVGNLCVDKFARGPADWFTSANTCAAAGLQLPSPSESDLLAKAGVLASGVAYWADDIFYANGGQVIAVAYTTGGPYFDAASDAGVYSACVTTADNQFSH